MSESAAWSALVMGKGTRRITGDVDSSLKARLAARTGPHTYRVHVYSENPITLRQLKAIEAIIGHDRIDLVPGTFEHDLSDVTPGAGFERGFISFEWTPGGDA